jgi:hypothetical protein
VTSGDGDLAAELVAARAECDRLRAELLEVSQSVVRWRAAALAGWSTRAQTGDSVAISREIDAIHNTVSWRVTKPLRTVRTMMPPRHG